MNNKGSCYCKGSDRKKNLCNKVKHFRTSKKVINYENVSIDINGKLVHEEHRSTRGFNNYYTNTV